MLDHTDRASHSCAVSRRIGMQQQAAVVLELPVSVVHAHAQTFGRCPVIRRHV